MAVYGVYEFVVLLESFKNIDLFRQGYYLVRAHLYTERITREGVKEKHKLALPYHILRESKASPTSIPADFDNSLNVFRSRTFRVQYCEEEILLQDACLFRFELNLNKPPIVFLELDLMFAEYTAAMHASNSPIPTLDQFSSQCTRVFLLNDLIANSVHGMMPVLFDDAHYSQLNLLVHSMVIENRFRQKSAGSHSSDVTPETQTAQPQSFQQVLFPSRPQPYEQKELISLADELHRHYVGCLLRPHLTLTKAFRETVSRCMSRRQRSELGFLAQTIVPARFPGVLKSEAKREELKGEEEGEDDDAVGVERVEEDPEEDLLATVGAVARARGYVHRRNSSSLNVTEDSGSRKDSDDPPAPTVSTTTSSSTTTTTESSTTTTLTKTTTTITTTTPAIVPTATTTAATTSTASTSSNSTVSTATPVVAMKEPEPRLVIPGLEELELESLSARLKLQGALTVEGITKAILADMQTIAPQNFELWNRFIHTLPLVCENLVKLHWRRCMKLFTQQTGAFVFRESYGVADRWKVAPLDLEAKHRSLVEIARGPNHLSGLPFPVIQQTQGSDLFEPSTQPVFFEEAYDWEQPQAPVLEGVIKVLDDHFEGASPAADLALENELSLEHLAEYVDNVCQWACLACTFINHGSLPKCELCSCPRDGAESIRGSASPPSKSSALPSIHTPQTPEPSSSSASLTTSTNVDIATTPLSTSSLSDSTPKEPHVPIEVSHNDPSHSSLPPPTSSLLSAPSLLSDSASVSLSLNPSTSSDTTTITSITTAATTTTATTTSTTTSTSTALILSPSPATPVRIVLPAALRTPKDMVSDASGQTGIIPNYPFYSPAAYKARLRPKRKRPYTGRHVFVLVHGYQGNVWDMRLFKNRLLFMFPNSLCLLSACNEGKTEGTIDDMGRRLATEVDDFIRDHCRNGSTLGRLSFVCHSLGGIIMRAALAQALEEPQVSENPLAPKRGVLRPYLEKLYTFISLAVPHCGYMYSENPLLTTGIWVLRRWKQSACLSQLSLADNQDPTECFIYKLSQQKGLEYFENILLLASMQDKYAPFHSARIELHSEAMNESKKGLLYRNMVHNLLGPLKMNTVKRFNIVFTNKANNFDAFIGRTAHIYFLDQVQYISMLCSVYKNYFI